MLKSIQKRKNRLRAQRKARVRGKIFGTADMPRLSVFKSNKYFYAQVIDDVTATTLVSVDGKKAGLKSNIEDVKVLAKTLSESMSSKNIDSVVFDRNGYLYHGVVASFADAIRDAGIKF